MNQVEATPAFMLRNLGDYGLTEDKIDHAMCARDLPVSH
jgi:hypothetical protein